MRGTIMLRTDEIMEKQHAIKWVEEQNDADWARSIASEFNIHPIIARVISSRNFANIDEVHNYLYGKLPGLHPPEAMLHMDKAIDRVYRAMKNEEGILIYGDNDVDGITGATLLVEFFRSIGIRADYYVPSRNALKFNTMQDAMEYAKRHDFSLFITVDCGITARTEIEKLIANEIDVIVTDHHEPTGPIPKCVATLNPKLRESTYPNRDLTGVGVAFKLAHGITNFLVRKGDLSPTKIDLKRFLDLVALGTIADMGALVAENRILVRYGLRQLNNSHRLGLIKLLSVCELNEEEMTTTDVASKVAPRLNSLGRIDDPEKGVELLLLRDEKEAERLALELDLNNIERQKIERRDSEDIETLLADNPDLLKEKAIVLHSDKWHPGIIPIITARIAKQYNRPTILIAVEEGLGKGSCRTIPEFPLIPPLHHCASNLINFGGHNYAAGLTIVDTEIESFKKGFIDQANQKLQDSDIVPKLRIDARINFTDLTFEFLDSLALLEPFGVENPAPIFYCRAKQTWPPKVVGKTHLKLYLEQNERVLEGIAFGFSERRNEICKKNINLEIAFTPYINTFLNKSSIQLLIRDFRVIQ